MGAHEDIMIITQEHPNIHQICIYGMTGEILSGITEVDTDKMEAERFVGFDITGYPVIITIPILKIKGPGIYFHRNIKGRMINAGKIKA